MTAPWAGRAGHTSVIDAAGTIYVIGGSGFNGIFFNDVWASTDGGARPDSGAGRSGVLVGYQGGTTGGGTRGVVLGYPRGSKQANPPTHAFQTFARAALPPSQHM
jgi:hypothetical protein